jgi:hypothetical protein
VDAERGRAGIRALQVGKLAASGAVIGAMLAVAVGTAPRGGLSSARANGSYQDPQKLTEMGLHFLPQPAPGVLPSEQRAISAGAAIAAATTYASVPGHPGQLLPNVNVVAEFGYFSNHYYGQRLPSGAIQPFIQNRPAWVMSFAGPGLNLWPRGCGVECEKFSPEHMKQSLLSSGEHEGSVVIDAVSGQYLELLMYR